MAIFGIGATYDKDVSEDFILNNCACIGWDVKDAPALYELLKTIKVGDIIYIKSSPIGQGLRVKGVGIVINNQIKTISGLGTGIEVNWIWKGHDNIGTINDKYNVRNNTLYEEFNISVQSYILKLLFSKIKK